MRPRCQVRLLGKFEVAVDGQPVPVDSWRSRRAADVVKLLALAPVHQLHREQVMAALWPDLAGEAAAANLRKAVHYARRALGWPDAFESRGGMLALCPRGELEVDLDRFTEAAAKGLAAHDADECRRAAAIYAGELLPADRYEEWTTEARARASARFLEVLRESGQWERVLELDETDERAHRELMQRHLEAGERREAIRQFERLRDALHEHIGVGPDAATVALYERVLAMEGDEPATPAERAAALLANGLVAWGRRDIAQAERLAREARAMALREGLGHELGEASTLLALVSYAHGTWHERFREEFADSVRRHPDLEIAVYDAHLCFQEFYLYGEQGHEGADAFARELLEIAERAESPAGQALATLLLGEFALLSGNVGSAALTLRRALQWAEKAGRASTHAIVLERLAEAEVALGNPAAARTLLARARALAASSTIPSHLVVRVFGVQVLAADSVVDALRAISQGERWISHARKVCDPCSMNFRIEAVRASARAGDLSRARRHLAEAERITGLWQGGPWIAAIWEARAELRRAEGQVAQANALLLEAADSFAGLRRPLDELRCRAAAARAG